MRQAYLQNGGNERDVLDQLSQMQAEAQRIEDEMKNSNYDNRHRGITHSKRMYHKKK